jgi:fructose-1,6-bisphosphatase/inositol monophosphatase family enzyme
MTVEQRREFLEFALRLVRAAEGQIMPYYHNCAVSQKPDGSDVTRADLASEQTMRRMIAQRFPYHAVLGEEQDAEDILP